MLRFFFSLSLQPYCTPQLVIQLIFNRHFDEINFISPESWQELKRWKSPPRTRRLILSSPRALHYPPFFEIKGGRRCLLKIKIHAGSFFFLSPLPPSTPSTLYARIVLHDSGPDEWKQGNQNRANILFFSVREIPRCLQSWRVPLLTLLTRVSLSLFEN